MADDNKPAAIRFPVEVTVNGVKVTVTLMLKPGTTVSLAEDEQQDSKEDEHRRILKTDLVDPLFEHRHREAQAVTLGNRLFLMA